MTLLIACSSDSEKLTDNVDAGVSWLATVELTGQGWLDNRVPARFAERTVEQAHKQLANARQSVATLHADPSGRSRALTLLGEATDATSLVADAVRRRDHAVTAQRLIALQRSHATLDSLLQALKQQDKSGASQ